MEAVLLLTAVAAVGSVIGAIFATWRWDYARRAFELQRTQLKLQVLMLMESREYWKMPKLKYVSKKYKFPESDKELVEILNSLLER